MLAFVLAWALPLQAIGLNPLQEVEEAKRRVMGEGGVCSAHWDDPQF